MPQINEALVGSLDPAQAADLSLLVDLEACWENLRKPASGPADAGAAMKDLSARQKAYDAFRVRLVAYNRRYAPAHVPELLLNTPSRLGAWCRRMRDLCLQIEHDPRCHCPVHLLAKAYRWADRIGVRMSKGLAGRAAPAATVGDVIGDLDALVRWCDELIAVADPGPRPELSPPAPHLDS